MINLCNSSRFHFDQQLSYAEILSPSESRARIEVTVLNFLKLLNSPNPSISDLHLINRTSKNTRIARDLFKNEASSLFLSHSLSKKSLNRSNATQSFIRIWKVLEICYQILLQEKLVTQRELFYKLISTSPNYFNSQSQVNRSVQDVIALLRCSRQSLGIMASSRGILAGRIILQEHNQDKVIDCSLCGSSGYSITGDLNLLEKLVIKSDARYILVIEKHAIFHRLAEDKVFNQIPSILITAKGYPDIATRFLLHKISRNYPNLPILGLVDWNPAGLSILCTFKYGSIGMGLEAYKYACDVKWLGLRGDDLQLIPKESLVPLKQRDLQIAESMMNAEILQDGYKEELELMVNSHQRAELEALYCHGYDFLGKYIATKIVKNDYI
ncbi:Meiotic recombination protein spo11-2 [Thalictrum thalictroides]|uniref:DNA topoisomerase (ATP-hydrolyzing) n=1 Tax=Thalictrum thalictroides TaxID=46969 RepID=A0A7J6VGW8_THATH|nr:Meiotic recombination protein spo11-2 [Thalictrum thalictroides]